MEEQSPLTGNDLVRARLDGLARTGGTPADFEEAVKQLAPTSRGRLSICPGIPDSGSSGPEGSRWLAQVGVPGRCGHLDHVAPGPRVDHTRPPAGNLLGEVVTWAQTLAVDDRGGAAVGVAHHMVVMTDGGVAAGQATRAVTGVDGSLLGGTEPAASGVC
jgi:hypothetical protein